MRGALIDAGPLIALFDSSDALHARAKRFLAELRGIDKIVSIDSDFLVCRTIHNAMIQNVFTADENDLT